MGQETVLNTRAETARKLRISMRTLDYLYSSGQLKGLRGGLKGGRVLFTDKAIQDYIAKLERQG